MSKKLTAVQYIEEKIKKYPELYFVMSLWFEDAKEMEKKQIISALKAGVNFEINCNIDSNTNLTYNEYFIKYYNKTYKN